MDIRQIIQSVSYTSSLQSEPFPYLLGYMGHVHMGQDFFTERDAENNYQIIYTVSGNGQLTYRNKTLTVEKHQAFLINCNEYHYYCTGDLGEWEYKYLHVRGSGFPDLCEFLNQGGIAPITLANPFIFHESFDRMIKIIENKALHGDLRIIQQLTNLVMDLMLNRNPSVAGPQSEYQQALIEQSLQYMQTHYTNHQLKVNDVAHSIGFSENYYSRLFKRITGTTPYEYINVIRIDRSKQYLKQTVKSVAQISHDVGFENINVFIRNFKKFTGSTPLYYRNYSESY